MYLGDEIKFDEPLTGNAEFDLRICIAEAKFYEIIKKLTNFKTPKNQSTYTERFNTQQTYIFLSNLEPEWNPNDQDKFHLHQNAQEASEKWL